MNPTLVSLTFAHFNFLPFSFTFSANKRSFTFFSYIPQRQYVTLFQPSKYAKSSKDSKPLQFSYIPLQRFFFFTSFSNSHILVTDQTFSLALSSNFLYAPLFSWLFIKKHWAFWRFSHSFKPVLLSRLIYRHQVPNGSFFCVKIIVISWDLITIVPSDYLNLHP